MYRVSIAVTNINANHFYINIPVKGISVNTQEGETYDAIFEINRNQMNQRLKVGKIELGNAPANVPISQVFEVDPAFGADFIETWEISFKVPEKLTPAELIIPGFDPLDLSNVQKNHPTIAINSLGLDSLPAEIQASANAILTIMNPRITNFPCDSSKCKEMSVLIFDIAIENTNISADEIVDINLDIIDSNGMAWSPRSSYCDYREKIYGNETIGPGQTKKGFLCFDLYQHKSVIANGSILSVVTWNFSGSFSVIPK